MKKLSLVITIFAVLLLFSKMAISQTAPDFGATSSTFILFTSAGELTNSGGSKVVGDIGTNAGAYAGFTPAVLIGTAHIVDGKSTTAASEMQGVYDSFSTNNPVCGTTLITPLGGAVELGSGVYCTGGPANLTGNLVLDANFNANAVFVFMIGGAFSTSSLSNIVLKNGAQASNVYWRVNGAFTLGEGSNFSGTVVAGGAIDLLEGASLFGRALTTAGAVTLHNNIVASSESALPVTLVSFNVKKGEGQTALLTWATTAETNSERFQIERSVDGRSWQQLGSVEAKGESTILTQYSYIDTQPDGGIKLYRLKMIDLDNSYAYSTIRNIEFSTGSRAVLYPNPVLNRLTLDSDTNNVIDRLQLVDMNGKVVYEQIRTAVSNLQTSFDVSFLSAGLYVGRIIGKGGVSYQKILKLK